MPIGETNDVIAATVAGFELAAERTRRRQWQHNPESEVIAYDLERVLMLEAVTSDLVLPSA
jgi:hypothetical protein